MTTRLLDVNLLIALAWPNHVHHGVAHRWFSGTGRKDWATCPLTQLGFVRVSSNPGIVPTAVSPPEAARVLAEITSQPGHRFWPDAIDVMGAPEFASVALVGHRQVTDAYLIALARHQGGKLATLDRGVIELIPDVAERRQRVELVE